MLLGLARKSTNCGPHVAEWTTLSPAARRYSRYKSLNASRALKYTVRSAATSESVSKTETEIRPGVTEGVWKWKGYDIRYQRSGVSGPVIVAVHGFGGNCDHWRRNIDELGKKHRVFTLDLLGYGFSSKPDPRNSEVNSIYNFDVWSDQVIDFMDEVIGGADEVFITSNSVGGIVALETAIKSPDRVSSIQFINVSLRMLHSEKQAAVARPFITLLQKTLRTSMLGPLFFKQIATEQGVRNVLEQCYGDKSSVTDELVDVILKPGLEVGAVHVFLDFISYSSGPTPERQLQQCPVPVSILWGEADPWEKIEWGKSFEQYDCVEEFVALPGVGHCPQDESPELVNPLIEKWVARHAKKP